ncbi:DUF5134 domain-containing protein [Streptomyces malaysiensis]|uniref:DUF5134 domain-containing protein n=1 Tax=Streptomyces malaysiensis subsp. samsunensis TaxID=459658 RepID=A0A9X2M407_STRMQ|nr:DUF5134 domain-containing protein [Streptomyces samsunensis]MCQ8836045.1 DUF5134 domain-containing protein [Streptomyces samsunensis]
MIAATGLRWILTVLFAAPVVYGVWRAVLLGTEVADRLDHALHAAMGVLMAAMAWPWGMHLPAQPQVVLFWAGALWFLAAAPFRAGDRSRFGAVLAAWPRVLMMGAMAWMVAAMNSSGTMAGHSGGGMHGMHMADASGLAAMTLAGTGPRLVAGVLAAVLAGIGLAWLARALDRARALDPAARPVRAAAAPGGGVVDALAIGCHAAMALGMAVMFVLLV